MQENKDNIVTLKIRNEDREWVKDEQRRLKKTEGVEPTHAALFQRLRSAYERAQGTEPPCRPQTGYPEWSRNAHDLLQLILDCDAQAADWIIGNLKMFAEAIRSRAEKPGGRRRAS